MQIGAPASSLMKQRRASPMFPPPQIKIATLSQFAELCLSDFVTVPSWEAYDGSGSGLATAGLIVAFAATLLVVFTLAQRAKHLVRSSIDIKAAISPVTSWL